MLRRVISPAFHGRSESFCRNRSRARGGVRIRWTLLLLIMMAGTSLMANELRVGVVGSEPFKYRGEKQIEGISVELWQEAAFLVGLRYRLVDMAGVPEGLRALEEGRIDVLVGSVSVTAARSSKVDFSTPYYVSHTGLLTRRDATSVWKTIKPFLRTTFLYGVVTLLSLLFLVGNIFFFFERGINPNIPDSYLRGVGTGMWFAVVTFTTVGYGDVVPATRQGRIVASMWMVIAMLTASSITAGIATSFTLFQLKHAAIESIGSINDRHIAVVKGTTGVDTARRYHARAQLVQTKDEALQLLLDGKVAAMLFDYPVLRYYLKNNPSEELVAIESRENREFYAFAVRNNPSLLRTINLGLLRAMEQGELKNIVEQYGM